MGDSYNLIIETLSLDESAEAVIALLRSQGVIVEPLNGPKSPCVESYSNIFC